MDACLCKPSPSHPAQTIASFPCAEDLLDPTADTVDGSVPSIKARLCLDFVASPHASGDNLGDAALGDDRPAKMVTAISAIGINIAGIVRQCIRTSLSVIDIGWRNGDLLDKSRIGVSAYMRLETMDPGVPCA